MWVALPLIVCAKYQRNRQRANGAVAPINSNSTAARSHSRNVTVSSQAKPRLTRPFGLRSRATWLLVFLTLTITVTWTPANLYFLLVTYIPHFDQTHGPFYSLKTILFELQPVMDPIVFFLAMKPLRNAVGSLFAPTPRVWTSLMAVETYVWRWLCLDLWDKPEVVLFHHPAVVFLYFLLKKVIWLYDVL